MILINEIFGPTIQGEGELIGQKTMFIRVAKCDYNCSWCDTNHDEGKQMTEDGVLMSLRLLSKDCNHVVITGGNPALYDLTELITILHEFTVSVETQGSLFCRWFNMCDNIVFSPKPPSSGMITDTGTFDKCIEYTNTKKCIKVVVMNDEDFEFAKSIHTKYFDIPFVFQPCNVDYTISMQLKSLKWLTNKVIQDEDINGDVRVLPQLHTLMYKNRRGV